MSRIREYWFTLSGLGTAGIADGRILRDVQITNKIALYLSLSSLAYLIVGELFNPVFDNVAYTLPLFLVGAIVLALNGAGAVDLSRTVLCLAVPYYLLIATLHLKFGPNITGMRYFTPRIAMLAGGLFPVLLFGTTARRPWWLMMFGTFLCLAIYDPLHNYLGVGYYQKGFTDTSYYSANFLFLLVYTMLVMSAYALKRNMERTEREREEAIHQLNLQNEELIEANNQVKAANQEILTQNEEIVAQNEHITAQEELVRGVADQLGKANQKIEQQRLALEVQNERLAQLLSDSDRNLVEANEELMKHNNELQQFSYTVSHHLRGPVARLLGLTNLFRMNHNPAEVMEHIRKSALELDQTLHDLGGIIDIRNEVYKVRERVLFAEQFEKVVNILKDQLPEVKLVTTDFSEAPGLISIPPVVFSLMYQLVSNAVMYKAPDRMMKVHVRSYHADGEIVLSVSDNGLGIDMALYANDVFKMYRTFHAHRGGRGMGLYLARTQADIIGARIAVKSEVNEGSTFSIFFRPSDATSAQLIFANEYATLKYHAPFEAFEFGFISEVGSEEFRRNCARAVDLIKGYRVSAIIGDARASGEVRAEDQEWVLRTLLGRLLESTVKKIIIVAHPHQQVISDQMKEVIQSTGFAIQFVNTPEEGIRAVEVFVPVR